jgi:hypothetical protein
MTLEKDLKQKETPNNVEIEFDSDGEYTMDEYDEMEKTWKEKVWINEQLCGKDGHVMMSIELINFFLQLISLMWQKWNRPCRKTLDYYKNHTFKPKQKAEVTVKVNNWKAGKEKREIKEGEERARLYK